MGVLVGQFRTNLRHNQNSERDFVKVTSIFLAIILAASLGAPTQISRANAMPAGFSAGGFVYPIMSPRLSSKFGPRRHPVRKVHRHHSGIDLAVPKGTPIRAIAGGTVVFADPYKGYGTLIVVQHPNGLTSHYGHCSKILAVVGRKVRAGEVIGEVGSTGLATGPHLHFELRENGKAINPEKFLADLTAVPQG